MKKNKDPFLEELKEKLPHGGGINDRWKFEHEDGKYFCSNVYEHIDSETGMYDRSIPFILEIPENDVMEFNVNFDENDAETVDFICEDGLDSYLDDLFAESLREMSNSFDTSITHDITEFARDGIAEPLAEKIMDGMAANGCTVEDVQKRFEALRKSVKNFMEGKKASVAEPSQNPLADFTEKGDASRLGESISSSMKGHGRSAEASAIMMAGLKECLNELMFKNPEMKKRLAANEEAARQAGSQGRT